VQPPAPPAAPGPPTNPAPGPGPGTPPVAKERPNVMVFLFDDMRFEGSLGVMPKTREWLAAGGTTFPDGYATTPLCCPERASIWSGRYMHNHGVIDNGFGDRLDYDWIMPRYLRDAGYKTALAGKFITDWDASDDPPHFDRWAVFQGGDRDAYFNVDGDGTRAEWTEPFLAERTVEFLSDFEAESDDTPWFIQVSPQAPHDGSDGSYESPEPYASAPVPEWEPTPAVAEDTDEEKADKAPFLRGSSQSEERSRFTHEGHMRALMTADAMVDDIMSHLAATGELDNTLVVFTSDNGYHWGERGLTSKGYPYVESVKVPFLVRWDGVFGAGAVDPRLVAGLDILPTVLDAANAAPELRYPLDGRSFLPGSEGRAELLLEFHEGHRGIHHWASLRTPGWQYIEWYEDDATTVEWTEHYDLAADPWQLESVVADDDPANDPDVGALSARLAAARGCAGSSGPNACP
ncbi:MAG: sulfatase-like hydrolase/transferase, partial [Acidimicrobiia bacterium]